MQFKNSNRRSAFTIIELLIVMAIIVLVAAVTLPSVKNLLKDQKNSQSARVVQGFAEAARARAIGSGRPVAMIIERMYADGSRDLEGNDTSTRLSIGEVFPPYEGDWANARAVVTDNPGALAVRGTSFADIALTEAASLWDPIASAPSGLATIGDVISFGDSQRTYRITGVQGPPTVPNFVRIFFDNPPFDPYVLLDAGPPVVSGFVTGEPTIFPTTPLRFRIFRKPSKSLVGGVSLPRGMCIDLSCSGGGTGGVDFGTESIASLAGAPHVPGVYGQVFIVFNSSGSVQEVYYSPAPGASLVNRTVGNTIHLLIGGTEQVFPSPLSYLGSPVIPSPGISARDETQYNALDTANYWVSINPFSGGIVSSQVQSQGAFPAVDPSASAAELLFTRIARSRSLARSGTQRVAE